MKIGTPESGFSLAEMLVALMGSSIVIGALLVSSVELQKSLHASEELAANHSDQRRLLDYVTRELRRAIGIASTISVGGAGSVPLKGSSIMVEGDTSLAVTLPGYYRSNSTKDAAYDQPLPVVALDNYVDYGTPKAHAAGVQVIFRKQFLATERSVCFIRLEGEEQSIIVRDADNLHLQVAVAADGRDCIVEVTFLSPYKRANSLFIKEREEMLLRNIRVDGPL